MGFVEAVLADLPQRLPTTPGKVWPQHGTEQQRSVTGNSLCTVKNLAVHNDRKCADTAAAVCPFGC